MLPGDFNPKIPSIKRLVILGIIAFIGMIGSTILLVVGIFVISAWWGQPLSIFGLSDGPDQPLEFPHTVHVQEAGVDCMFCHRNVTKGASATVPAVGLCMTCHKTIGDDIEEVEKLLAIKEKAATNCMAISKVFEELKRLAVQKEMHSPLLSYRRST